MEVNKIISNKFKTIILGFWDPDGYYFNREGYDKHGNLKNLIIFLEIKLF